MPRDRNSSPNRIVVAAVAVLAAPLIYWAAAAFMMNRAERATEQIQSGANSAMDRLQANHERREQERRAHAARVRLQEIAAQQEAFRAEQEKRDAERRKELAWARYFVAPTACERPPTWEFQVECGNRYMRAKREFEARWERGDTEVVALVAGEPASPARP